MGKKAKVGKSRKDRFYSLAKETGFRSRAAFKLIQLNRQYEFLQKSQVIIDLCAAPGGWLQVCAENAPMSNLIIGIDLVAIPPIPGVKTFESDITSDHCRTTIKKELLKWKADCFLNDGAPNVGKNWLHDAFQQAELTLAALRLATEFLRRGGWFITKVFRSKDYDSLMWVFKQLFREVNATKPLSSRKESAEIFVVCQGFLAPEKLDPKFLDPKHVFKEIDDTQRRAIDLIHPEKKRRQRDGYPEGDYTLFHSLPVTEFFASKEFEDLLARSSEIALDSEEIKNHPLTTTEIKECLKDIKLLGKREIKNIFKWRVKVKADIEGTKESDEPSKEMEVEPEEKGEEKDEDDIEMEALDNMLLEKSQEEMRDMKKAKKKVRKAQQKQQFKINMEMLIPGDRPDMEYDENIFDITKIKSKKDLTEIEKGESNDFADIFDDSDDDVAPKKKPTKVFDKDEKRYIGIEGGGESDDDEDEIEMEEEPDFEDDDGDEMSNDETEEDSSKNETKNPLLLDMGVSKKMKMDKQSKWFQKASFAGLDDDIGDDLAFEKISSAGSLKVQKQKSDTKQKKSEKKEKIIEKKTKIDFEDDDFSGSEEDQINSESDSEIEDSDDELLGAMKKAKNMSNKATKTKTVNGIEVVPIDPSLRLDEEGLAIGAEMIKSRKRKREIIDTGYHRYMFDDDNLPDWFSKDERKHMRRPQVVTKEQIEEYKLKQKSIDAAPIKKVAEAKGRKKRKELKRLESARKKANLITENDAPDVSEKEKWQRIKHIYKKAGLLNKKKASVTYVVAKKGAGKKVRRPKGVKGKFKVVDGRLKKDVRGKMRADARKSGKKQKTGPKHRHTQR